jgi:hypothetical protein
MEGSHIEEIKLLLLYNILSYSIFIYKNGCMCVCVSVCVCSSMTLEWDK